MTATPQPLGRLTTVLDHIIRGLAWGTQVAAATTYLIVAARPAAWQPMLDKNPVSVISAGLFTLGMLTVWALSLWGEQSRFYDRSMQRSHRKIGLIGHLSVLIIAAAVAAESPGRVGLWIILGFLCFSAVTTWASWMQTRLLPDEDQAVIDSIISREVAQRAAVYDASEREQRRTRLTAIVESLGYTLTDTPAAPGNPAEAPAVRWTIPAGKHAPLVYFIRNGNRMKIGTTTELKRRIRTLALRPENVALLVNGDRRREREYHKQFAEHRIGTSEWFAYEGTLADHVHAQTVRYTQKGQEQ
ncbi:GIY-YIG nuclease family protein [Streptomyces bottropensis]|uniref:GIY-YIG nuclease family protein n=1 Tax=Streptomyces bottropensis TaxID=42235 RepID=UPI00368224DE